MIALWVGLDIGITLFTLRMLSLDVYKDEEWDFSLLRDLVMSIVFAVIWPITFIIWACDWFADNRTKIKIPKWLSWPFRKALSYLCLFLFDTAHPMKDKHR